jgi:hypothetical protein
MGNPSRNRQIHTARPSELLCSACCSWKPDDMYLVRPGNDARRGRGVTCVECREKRKDRYLGRLHPQDIDLSDEWPARPPEMQGRAQSIFAPWNERTS